MKKLHVAFLWHQHQPYYKNLANGRSMMPWTRLHATKDYYDMVAILDEFPNVRLTINLVPSLVSQLLDYSTGNLSDLWIEKTLVPPEQLSEQDKIWILENFFYCNWETMIYPNARYKYLLNKKGKFSTPAELERIKNYFSAQDFLDLQVWFNLAWMDPLLREKDPLIKTLYEKGENFSQEEKEKLIARQKEICAEVISKHKELWDKGQIEVSTTPFYHPILPLLCNSNSAEMAMPGFLRPQETYAYSEDARAQIKNGLDYIEKIFGRRPIGMWPSEGSVSKEAVSLMSQEGVLWAASDESILASSLKNENRDLPRINSLYQSWQVLGQDSNDKLQMVFRDHGLSDSIGFNYSRIPPQKAVDDLLHNLEEIAKALPDDGKEHLVSIILDGENCWEYYPFDGIEFLRNLYGRLSNHEFISTTTIGQFIKDYPTDQSLNMLWSGSWINNDFSIWIGQPEDNAAWNYLQNARKFLTQTLAQNPELASSQQAAQAWQSLYIAEGSDWFWWYGDQNSSAHDDQFDLLFRLHIKNIYQLLGAAAPDDLNISIKRKEPKGRHDLPVGFINPKIDGLVSNYYEWKSAGQYQAFSLGHTMHVAETVIASIYYGFNLEKLFFRIDLKRLPVLSEQQQISFKIIFLEPIEKEIHLTWQRSVQENDTLILKAYLVDEKQSKQHQAIKEVAFQKNIELAVEFEKLGIQVGENFRFMVLTLKNGVVFESWPNAAAIETTRPTEDFASENWSV